MDSYTEQIIACRPSVKSSFLSGLGTALLVLGVFVFMFIYSTIGCVIFLVGVIISIIGKKFRNMEYEYLFINGDCDVARILNKSSRKNMFSFKEGDVQRILPYDSLKFQNELEVNSKLQVKNFTSGNKKKSSMWYSYIVNGKSGNIAVILELNEKNIEHSKNIFKTKFETQ